MRNVVIAGYARSPFTLANKGALTRVRPDDLAAQVVGARFDAADRELLLINDRRDFDTYPLATLSGLQYALSAVAQKMDPDRDILFLALSSHGSPDPLLAVSNAGLPLAQIDDVDPILHLDR